MTASKMTSLKKSALVLGAAVVAMTGVFAAPAHAKKPHVHIYLGGAGVGARLRLRTGTDMATAPRATG